MLTDEMQFTNCSHHNDLLSDRSENQAYCLANPGAAYAVFFTDGGQVTLDVSAADGKDLRIRWLNIMQSKWSGPSPLAVKQGKARPAAPSEGFWAALVTSGKS